ncbi:MAG TPA: DUF3027 domain-containing protein [Arthrobacter sp.]|nr:DUF3027 domain-containing protein [Arthrobacter sp.]
MNPEAEQPEPAAVEQAADTTVKAAATETKRRAGVPVWRTGKPDAFLAAAVDVARTAVESITAPSTIGRHVAARSEGDRLVTHLFESRLPGYQGWHWFAVLTRNSRSKAVTVNELGLLPSEDSILAPEWVPWAERVRPEDAQDAEALDAVYAPDDLQAEPATEEPGADEPGTDEPGTDEPGEETDAGETDTEDAGEPDAEERDAE